jgi:tetratricopeptide (TPR) repeat protein
MGVNTLAISKFYAVMGMALKLKLANMDYYKKLVLQAQVEIADTYYMDGKYSDASDYYTRLLKGGNLELNLEQTHYKLVRSLSYLSNTADTVSQADIYLNLYTNTIEVPEVRFILASAYKKMNRNNDALKQVLLLLESQADNVKKNPELWAYWQQRAGNEIASQLYKEGDFINALQIYSSLVDLNKTAAWQLPIDYQIGLIYEQLQQWPRATAMYNKVLDRQKELTDKTTTPTLASLVDMAKWRKDYIAWLQKARLEQQSFVLMSTNNGALPTVKQ